MDNTAQSWDTQIQNLQKSITDAKLPPALLEKSEAMLSLLQVSLKQGGSYTNLENIKNYLDTITKIPFEKETQDILDLNHAKQVLDKNHYGLASVKNRILEYLSSLILNTKEGKKINRAPIICLTGLVGTGKTTLSYSIAESLGRNFQRIPLGGMGDVRDLRGQSRTFPDAQPGQIIKKLIAGQSRNCVILLDELDRVTETGRSDIMGALVELLDPEQNSAFVDHYIDYPVDLSKVLFIATTNNTSNISTAVLDRLELIQMPAYSDQEKMIIGKNYLLPRIMDESGLAQNTLRIEDVAWPEIIRPLGYDSGIRSLEKTIEGICRKVARAIVEGKASQGAIITITPRNIKEFLNNG